MGFKDLLNSYLNHPAEGTIRGLTLGINEPPCKGCKHFRPRYTTDSKGNINGVVLCKAKEMHNDFSCFEERV